MTIQVSAFFSARTPGLRRRHRPVMIRVELLELRVVEERDDLGRAQQSSHQPGAQLHVGDLLVGHGIDDVVRDHDAGQVDGCDGVRTRIRRQLRLLRRQRRDTDVDVLVEELLAGGVRRRVGDVDVERSLTGADVGGPLVERSRGRGLRFDLDVEVRDGRAVTRAAPEAERNRARVAGATCWDRSRRVGSRTPAVNRASMRCMPATAAGRSS